MIISVILLSLTLWSTQAQAQSVEWHFNCDYYGSDIGNEKSSGEDCGGLCLSRSDCTRFTWTNYEGGTCWLKNGYGQSFRTNNGVCGTVNRTPIYRLKVLV